MMDKNISFYKFMHKQVLAVVILLLGTAPSYLIMGYLFSKDMMIEWTWFSVVFLMSLYGYKLYQNFDLHMSIENKEAWLTKVKYFIFSYFSVWTYMFVMYVLSDDVQMHYVAIGTQLGVTVVASTVLASQKKLLIYTISSLMFPLTVYFIVVGESYTYLLASFTVVLSFVILYAASNTHNYLLKSNFQAYHDYLTGLGNRRHFLEILDDSVRQYKNKYAYLLMVDLDYFKTINDTLGHDIGDALLIEVSKRMKQLSDNFSNTVARLGGDEFCILSQPFDNYDKCLKDAISFSDELLTSLKDSYYIEGNQLYISASIGVSIIGKYEIQANEFLKEADLAMYEAKNNGRDGVILFNDKLSQTVRNNLEIERVLHFALEKNEISLVYQPQVDKYQKVIGCEILVRWHSQELGFVGPDIFIPIAERTGYIIILGEYILEESYKTIKDWSQKNIDVKQVSINISMRQLLHQDFIALVGTLYDKYITDACKIDIIFEITETSTTEDLGHLVKIIDALKKYNISFSMDDFGTGYSSLSYLREIPISELKIDQSFVANLADSQQAILVKSIVELAKNFHLTIVAEGVEEVYQQNFLEELDCDLYQGYLFSKPISKVEFEKFCTR